MDDRELWVACLKVAADRNQKLSATPASVVEEAVQYFSLAPDVKKDSPRRLTKGDRGSKS